MHQSRFRSLPLAAALALGIPACGTMAARNAETAAARALISPEQENQLGAQVKTQLEQQEGIQYVTDPAITNYVNGVAGRLIDLGRRARPDMNWQVHVINDPRQVNAFATPGGYLYVFTGLLDAAENEAEFAGVMGHEVAHVVGRHSARRLVSAYGLQAVAAMALGQNPGLLAQVATAAAAQGVMLKNSRRDETEADELGARMVHAAGWDPNGLSTFFAKLKAKEGSTPGFLKYLSSHPAPQDRIDHLNQYTAAKGLRGGTTNPDGFAQMKARLRTIPAPAPRPAGAPPSGGAPPPGGAPPAGAVPSGGAPPPGAPPPPR